jgi:hypothetical protein
MEFKDHGGPIYALHRVFRLNDADWPRAEVRDDERESGMLEEPLDQAALRRRTPTHTGG